MLDLPKNPKAEDLIPILSDLDARVAALETWRVSHSAGMARRQAQITAMDERARRDKWLSTLKGRRRG